MSNHTPGEWILGRTKNGTPTILDSVGRLVATMCEVSDMDTRMTSPCKAETREANAKLIVSAPDLLEACKFALDMPDGVSVVVWNEARVMMRAAIAKAAGEVTP